MMKICQYVAKRLQCAGTIVIKCRRVPQEHTTYAIEMIDLVVNLSGEECKEHRLRSVQSLFSIWRGGFFMNDGVFELWLPEGATWFVFLFFFFLPLQVRAVNDA